MFTVLTLVVTLVHLDKFHLGAEHPASARAITWGWLAIYAGVPVAMVVGLVLQARAGGTTVVDVVRLPAGLRWLLVGLAALLLATGVALLLAPEWAAEAWAWPLTPLTARAIGAWLVGLGWAAAHARLVDDRSRCGPSGSPGRRSSCSRRWHCSATATRSTGRAGRRRRTSPGWRGSRSCPPGSCALRAAGAGERGSSR